VELVGRHHHCPIFIPQQSENAVVQQMRANVRIHSRERIVQKDHLGALVDSAGEVDQKDSHRARQSLSSDFTRSFILLMS
jgi:hypothetical protein